MEIANAGSSRPYYPTNPDVEPVDSRFPASMNALISEMTPAERDEFFEIYQPYATSDADREARQETSDRAAYEKYLDERSSGAPVPPPFETWVAGRDRQLEQERLANFREMTGNPNATVEDMYAAGEAHQADLVEEELALLQETDPDATLVDVGQERLDRRARRAGVGGMLGRAASLDTPRHSQSNSTTESRPVSPNGGHSYY